MKRLTCVLVFAMLAGGIFVGPPLKADDPIDWPKARQLYQRSQKGDKLTDEEQAYLDRAKAERQKTGPGRQGQPQGNQPAIEPKESTGLVPLTDLKDKYKDQDGGLYGGGSNEIPAAHLKLAIAAAKQIQPLDSDGKPAAGGKIVLMSIGMSNTTNEFSVFQRHANADAERNPAVVVVDAAQGGRDAPAWANEGRREQVWQTADQKLSALKVTPRQVQAVWIKQAIAGPAKLGDFPKSTDALRDDFVKIVQLAKERYPNLQLAYLSSRIYAGYAGGPLNPEPYAYEGAFAVRGAIQVQMKGDASLNADPAKGDLKAPVMLWGPYLWSDGTKGRKLDELIYKREDLREDGTHPSASGAEKVSQLLTKFFKTDPTAKNWYAKP